jgi:outer membrane protein assembly factor BamB
LKKHLSVLALIIVPLVWGIGYSTSTAWAQNGTVKWTYQTGGPVRSSPAIGPDGTIYVGSSGSAKLHAINPNGTEKWSFQAGG